MNRRKIKQRLVPFILFLWRCKSNGWFALWEWLCGVGGSWLWDFENRLRGDSMWGQGRGKQHQTPNPYICHFVLLKFQVLSGSFGCRSCASQAPKKGTAHARGIQDSFLSGQLLGTCSSFLKRGRAEDMFCLRSACSFIHSFK